MAHGLIHVPECFGGFEKKPSTCDEWQASLLLPEDWHIVEIRPTTRGRIPLVVAHDRLPMGQDLSLIPFYCLEDGKPMLDRIECCTGKILYKRNDDKTQRSRS